MPPREHPPWQSLDDAVQELKSDLLHGLNQASREEIEVGEQQMARYHTLAAEAGELSRRGLDDEASEKQAEALSAWANGQGALEAGRRISRVALLVLGRIDENPKVN